MVYDNINITGQTGNHVHIIGHEPNQTQMSSDNIIYENKNRYISFFDKSESEIYIRNNDEYILKDIKGITDHAHLPKYIHTTNIKVFFPDYSVDTYVPGTRYAISLNTWINGKQINLGTKILNRLDTVASDVILDEKDYNEYISFDIIDPYYIIYSDEWKDFRINVCGESQNPDNSQINSTGSFLYCSLQPLEKLNDHYILLDGYTGGHNSLNISQGKSDYLHCNIHDNIDSPDNKDIMITCELEFNELYKGDLRLYLKETYGIEEDIKLIYKLMLFDGENVYNTPAESPAINTTGNLKYNFKRDDLKPIFNPVGTDKMSMQTYKDGFKFVVVAMIRNLSNETLLHIISNDIILTKEKFIYFIDDEPISPSLFNIPLNAMPETYNINAVNKIINKVIQIDKPEDSKSNIIMPVFFKVNNLANIVLHPEVNENISINLDSYKSKVRSFIIQIEGVQFVEIGRTDAGVIFKIIGKKLPREINKGTYYILNENQDMVVSGKYTYEL